jgi:hypothetical protein
VTWTVAAVAVETGIPPYQLLGGRLMEERDAEYLFGYMVAYMNWRSDEQRKAAKRRG